MEKNLEDLKEIEMKLFELEYDEKPSIDMISIFTDEGVKIYRIREEFGKGRVVV